MILEEATLSFNKSIFFPVSPNGFAVTSVEHPGVSPDEVSKIKADAYENGKKEATNHFLSEVKTLREDFASRQKDLLSKIDANSQAVLQQLDSRLPDLVLGLAERVLGKLTIDGLVIEKMVKAMISEFSEEDEKLEVYLCPNDLALLKNMADLNKEPTQEDEGGGGFASAIAGIFDGLDGDDELLEGYPNVKFFEDPSLENGDCQIKSRFGLLDGRISTKLRRIEQELKGD